MSMSSAERQRKYRKRIKSGERRRLQLVLSLEVAIKIDYLTDALQCNQVELLSRLLLEEWERQGDLSKLSLFKRQSNLMDFNLCRLLP